MGLERRDVLSRVTAPDRAKVVIAGASGFVGRAVIEALKGHFDVIALSRSERGSDTEGVEWRSCDLFSLLQCERAVAGADFAIYLVHSMLPATLTQASFDDMDLILADNFARAARKVGVRQIVYLGGLIPRDTDHLSKHLASRLEVEGVLAARGIPVTTLRAGLILGAGGSSFQMMRKLVERLPVMVCPKWTMSKTQPVAVRDVVRTVQWCLGREEAFGRHYDLGGPDVMNYRDMMQRTAVAIFGRRRAIATVPFFTPGLSVAWVRLITGAHRELVKPLVQSLRHDMCVNPDRTPETLAGSALPFDEALRRALSDESPDLQSSRSHLARCDSSDGSGRYVVSIQRLPLPAGRDARWVAREYARWLPRLLRFILKVTVDDALNVEFRLSGLSEPLLRLEYSETRSTPDRPLYYITGGMLFAPARPEDRRSPARLEFRETPDGRSVMAAIFNYCPKLPWHFYRFTQAPAHLAVMRLFGRHLRRMGHSSR